MPESMPILLSGTHNYQSVLHQGPVLPSAVEQEIVWKCRALRGYIGNSRPLAMLSCPAAFLLCPNSWDVFFKGISVIPITYSSVYFSGENTIMSQRDNAHSKEVTLWSIIAMRHSPTQQWDLSYESTVASMSCSDPFTSTVGGVLKTMSSKPVRCLVVGG